MLLGVAGETRNGRTAVAILPCRMIVTMRGINWWSRAELNRRMAEAYRVLRPYGLHDPTEALTRSLSAPMK